MRENTHRPNETAAELIRRIRQEDPDVNDPSAAYPEPWDILLSISIYLGRQAQGEVEPAGDRYFSTVKTYFKKFGQPEKEAA